MTIILSIKPYYLYLILIGKKTIELRKSMPKNKKWNKTALLYCSKDMQSFALIPEKDRGWMRDKLGKIACKITIDEIYKVIPTDTDGIRTEGIHSAVALKESCLRISEMREYLNGKISYGLHISSRSTLEPGKLVIYGKRPPQSWCYVSEVS